jgi:uncharacterized membrane protein
MALRTEYVCNCRVSSPLIHLGEDTGLCQACNGIYDDRLYEMRLHQHVANFKWDSIEDFLNEIFGDASLTT